jgi:hypothetical protein
MDAGLVAVSYTQDTKEVIHLLSFWLNMPERFKSLDGTLVRSALMSLTADARVALSALDTAGGFGIGQIDPSFLRGLISLAMARKIMTDDVDFAYNERYAWEELNRLSRLNEQDLKQVRSMLSSIIGQSDF